MRCINCVVALALLMAAAACGSAAESSGAPAPGGVPTADGEAPPPALPVQPGVRIVVTDPAGKPLAGVPVSVHGSDDWRPRLEAQTDASGSVALDLHEPGYVEIVVGDGTPAPKNCGFGPGDAAVVGLWVDEPMTVRARSKDAGFELDAGGEAWPVAEARERYLAFLEQLMPLATAESPDPGATSALVDRHWARMTAEPNDRLRKLLAIQYAVCVAQLTGPEPVLRVFGITPVGDRAWIPMAPYLPQALWKLGDHARAGELVEGLPRSHRDPGLEARVLHWRLSRAHERGEANTVARLYTRLAAERYRRTNGFRDARKFNPDRPLRIGGSLPPFSVVKLGAPDTRISHDQLPGRTWVINVWSSWCRPCMEELDALPELYGRLRADDVDVEFLSISTDDEREACEGALEGRGLPWTVAWADDPEALRRGWGFAGVPLTLVVDKAGTVAALWDQGTSMQAIEKAVRAAAARDE